MKKLVIFPFNGNGIEALDCIDSNEFDFLGFIDDDKSKQSEDFQLFSRDILTEFKELHVLAVPGSPASFKLRTQVINSLNISPDRYVNVIHPSAFIGKQVKIGYNCLIMAGVVLTSNVVVGNHVCILPNSVIHHDSTINHYTLIGSNVVIAGGCKIGENCYIGSGSNVINGIQVEDGALIGLGSNIITNVNRDAKMVGNPARNLNPG